MPVPETFKKIFCWVGKRWKRSSEKMNIAEKPEKSIVYGVYGGQEGFIVFIEKTEAERLANACDAICRAKTWGEFRDLVWAETYEDIAGDEEWWSYEDFLEFGELEDGEEARLEYEKFEERVPLDKDPFDSSKSVGGYWDGVYFQVWPKGMMVDWVPESIQKKFGKLESTFLDGSALCLSANREKEIVAAFRKLGYEVKKDQELVATAGGHSPDL